MLHIKAPTPRLQGLAASCRGSRQGSLTHSKSGPKCGTSWSLPASWKKSHTQHTHPDAKHNVMFDYCAAAATTSCSTTFGSHFCKSAELYGDDCIVSVSQNTFWKKSSLARCPSLAIAPFCKSNCTSGLLQHSKNALCAP